METFSYFTVTSKTTLEELQRQYRILAKKYHPDTHGGEAGKEKFQEVRAEYERVLSYLKQRQGQPGNIQKARQLNQFITDFTEQFISEPGYRPIAREGMKLLIRLFTP